MQIEVKLVSGNVVLSDIVTVDQMLQDLGGETEENLERIVDIVNEIREVSQSGEGHLEIHREGGIQIIRLDRIDFVIIHDYEHFTKQIIQIAEDNGWA